MATRRATIGGWRSDRSLRPGACGAVEPWVRDGGDVRVEHGRRLPAPGDAGGQIGYAVAARRAGGRSMTMKIALALIAGIAMATAAMAQQGLMGPHELQALTAST